MGIIDESIQIGREKLLLLLGVKIEDTSSLAAPLKMEDVEVLGLAVQTSWTGTSVAEFIGRRLRSYPQLCLDYLISDQGSNLRAAMRQLRIEGVADCSHMMMNMVKRLIGPSKALSILSGQIGQLRLRFVLTELGYLLLPSLWDKDRFERIFLLVDWADRIDRYWDSLPAHHREPLQFLRQARPLIQQLRQVKTLIVITSAILKSAGLSQSSRQCYLSIDKL